jgi:hypothetical protein
MSQWPPAQQALTGRLTVRFYQTWEMPNTFLEKVQLLLTISRRTLPIRCDLGLRINIPMPTIVCISAVS